MKFLHLLFLYVFGVSCLSTIAQQASPDPQDDAQALAAIHRFLRFQIQDHQTGDSLEVQR
jgi:hypothetical protein